MKQKLVQSRGTKYIKLCRNVARLTKRGDAPEAIADHLCVSIFAVRQALRSAHTELKAQETAIKPVVQKPVVTSEPCEVPRWVPDRLVGTYQDLADRHDEEHAASVVRRLKAEARA